jgi:hypothetical protein
VLESQHARLVDGAGVVVETPRDRKVGHDSEGVAAHQGRAVKHADQLVKAFVQQGVTDA